MIGTLADYKSYLKISGTAEDTWLTSQITEIEDKILNYLGRDLASTNYTEIYDGNGTTELILRQYPITAVTLIEYYDDDDGWTAKVADTDYTRLVIYNPAYKIILIGGTFDKGVQNIRVTYTAGYSTVPGEIKQVMRDMVAYRYKTSPRAESRLGLKSKVYNAGAGQTEIYDTEFEDSLLKRLSYYRAWNV